MQVIDVQAIRFNQQNKINEIKNVVGYWYNHDKVDMKVNMVSKVHDKAKTSIYNIVSKSNI